MSLIAERETVFPAVTICRSDVYKMSGTKSLLDARSSERTTLEQMLNGAQFTALDFAENIVLRQTKPFKKMLVMEDLENFDPKQRTSWKLINRSNRIFLQNVHEHLYNVTLFSLQDMLVTCTFDNINDCMAETRFEVHPDYLSCLTFNKNGKEKVRRNGSGLEMTLYLNNTEDHGTIDGIGSFIAVIHEPNIHPSINQHGIAVNTGLSTTIRVNRKKVNRLATERYSCNKDSNYSMDKCLHDCMIQECISRIPSCTFFQTNSNLEHESFRIKNLTLRQLRKCYFAFTIAAGTDPMALTYYQVSKREYISIVYPIISSNI